MKRLLLVLTLTVPVLLAGCGTQLTSSGSQTSASIANGDSSSAAGSASNSDGSPSGANTGSSSSGSTGTTGSSGSSNSGSSGSSGSVGTVISNIQTSSGNWQSWGQLPPYTADCSAPCPGVTWSMNFGATSPSLSGNATQFNLGGTTPYADALFSAQLIGQNSPQIPDADHTLLPTLHNFIYDSYFYVTDTTVTQELEFDISMYMNGVGMIWGHQCNNLGDGDWDIWDNSHARWVSAGVPCEFVDGWNHVRIQVQRQDDNTLVYQSIELNGVNYPLNITSSPGTAAASWWGVTANYQMDGDSSQSPNTTYVDNFSVTYW
jgi:hypothetical protein